MVKGTRCGVPTCEWIAKIPNRAKRCQHRRVPVLLGADRSFGYPGGDEHSRDAIAGPVEAESQLARRCIGIRGWHSSGGNVIVRTSGLVEADEEHGVEDVRARR